MNLPVRKVLYNSNLLYSLRILVSLSVSTFVPWSLGYTQLVIPITLGVVAAALTDIDDRLIGRIRNLLLTIICFLIASLSVELLFPYPPLFLIGLLVATFGFVMLGVLGQRYAVIAFGSLLIAAYTMIGYHMYKDPFTQSFYLIIGVLWYNTIALIESILLPVRSTQHSLANCFYLLANYLDCKAAMFDPDETSGFKQQILALTNSNQKLVAQLNQTKDILFQRLKSGRGQHQSRRMLNDYFVAQDIHERVSSSHGQYQALSRQFRHSDILFRFARILNLQSKACIDLAASLRLNQTYQHNSRFVDYFSYLREAIDQLNPTDRAEKLLVNSLSNLYKNLHDIDSLLANIDKDMTLSEQQEDNRLVDDQITGWRDIYQRIKPNLTVKSALFRHAIRMSIVLSIDYLIIQMTNLPHSYWIILTSLFVCQPNYSTTRHRLKLRVLGTVIGILLGLPLTYLLPNIEAQLVLIILSGWLFFLFKGSQYAYATAFITLLVFFSFGLVGESSLSVAAARIIATLIGCFIAWLGVTYIWPDWLFRNIKQLVEKICHNDSHYFALIGYQYQSGKLNDANYRLSRRKAHESDSELFNLINSMSVEPHTNPAQIEKGFRLLTLNHTLLSFISTLGAHRNTNASAEVMALFDDTVVYTINTINGQQLVNPDELSALKTSLLAFLDQHPPQHEENINLLIIQQLILIVDLLPEFTQLVVELSATLPVQPVQP
ncbi:YccS family putative transporter [Utexia brackfieldae]|uniref:YccS family putative transporter n=1 Tax=Utexia brackfieldae TaxID=3074108 RepID=UPI00370D2415